ncbi:MAG: DUF1501 domain-containing protein [Myxococcales bacterium]|nr:DUF1501 domain-containing protein [Myxococcales bacterium]
MKRSRHVPPASGTSLSRRRLVGLLPASIFAGLGLSRLARADVGANDRKFLFVFAQGGWDPTWVFAPEFDNSSVDMPTDDSQSVTQGGLTWVSSTTRPSVDAFLTTYANRTCIVNGMEVRSIAHERCRRLLFTGGSSADINDFPTRIAMGAPSHLALGNVVFSGPSYADSTASGVVRIGENGQLGTLIDGSCAGTGLRVPSTVIASLEDAYVLARAQKAASIAGRGAEARIAAAYTSALIDTPTVTSMADLLQVNADDPLDQLLAAATLLASGAARCVTVADLGVDNVTWDHHSEITRQGTSFELLFERLITLMQTLDSTPGAAGGTLADEVTVVVCSEMGRYPQLNTSMGKDHWTTTSLMLLGGGIRGGQVIGGYDANMGGVPVIPATGESDPDGVAGGVVLQPAHLGATLLALAGLDPAEAFGDEVEPVLGAIST